MRELSFWRGLSSILNDVVGCVAAMCDIVIHSAEERGHAAGPASAQTSHGVTV